MATPLVDRLTRTPLDADAHVGFYGPGTPDYGPDGEYGIAYRRGLLSEHADAFLAAGGKIEPVGDGGAGRAILSDGSTVPVVCSELIEVLTEDGRESGRCGADAADAEPGLCESHGAQYRSYLADTLADPRWA